MKTERQDGHLQATERDLTTSQTCPHLDQLSSLQDCERGNFDCVSHHVGDIVVAILANEYREGGGGEDKGKI